jgi:hypothetical protein
VAYRHVSASAIPSVQSNSLKNIDAFFDKLERIFERTERLVLKAKYLTFGLAFLLFLVYEMILFGRYLLSNWP